MELDLSMLVIMTLLPSLLLVLTCVTGPGEGRPDDDAVVASIRKHARRTSSRTCTDHSTEEAQIAEARAPGLRHRPGKEHTGVNASSE